MRGWRLAATQWPTCATRLRSDGVGELAAEHHARAGLRVLETVRGGRVGAGIRVWCTAQQVHVDVTSRPVYCEIEIPS